MSLVEEFDSKPDEYRGAVFECLIFSGHHRRVQLTNFENKAQ